MITKIDLIDITTLEYINSKIEKRITNVPVISISNVSKKGLDELIEIIEKGKTYCLLGFSGVGKSTLFNSLCGKDIMRTSSLSESTKKGRHVTTHRELILLDKGGLLIDNPGMRQVDVTDVLSGMERTFEVIYDLIND